MNSELTFSRRQLIGAGLGLAAAMHPATAGSSPAPSMPGRNELYARARGGAGDEPGMWWYSGRLWGKPVNDQATNLFAVEGFSFNRMLRRPDGRLRQIMEECGFWKDPDTRQILDEWVNPLNGLSCEASHYRSRQDLTFASDGTVLDGGSFRGHITEASISGPNLWISESLHLSFPTSRKEDEDPLTYPGPVRTATSLVTYTMDTDAALAEDAGFVASTMNFQSMSSWYPWMRMGQAQGHMMFELYGRKLSSLDEIPPGLRAALEERRAGFLTSPNL